MVVVNKPATVPVHPTGQYRLNSVTALLAAQHRGALGKLCPVHRLDRNVSGLLVLARGAAAADSLARQIQGGLVVKEYVALVSGLMQPGLVLVEAPLVHDPKANPLAFAQSCRRDLFLAATIYSGFRFSPFSLIAGSTNCSSHRIRVQGGSHCVPDSRNGPRSRRIAGGLPPAHGQDASDSGTPPAPRVSNFE